MNHFSRLKTSLLALMLLSLATLAGTAQAFSVPSGYASAAQITIANTGATTLTSGASGYTATLELTTSTTPSTTTLTTSGVIKDYVTTMPSDGSAIDSVNYPSGYPADLTVWYSSNGGTTFTQIDAEVRRLNSVTGAVSFRLQASLAAGATDNASYIVAWGNASPTVKDVLANIYLFADDFTTNLAATTSGVPATPSGFTGTYLHIGGETVTVANNTLQINSTSGNGSLAFPIPGNTAGTYNPFQASVEAEYVVAATPSTGVILGAESFGIYGNDGTTSAPMNLSFGQHNSYFASMSEPTKGYAGDITAFNTATPAGTWGALSYKSMGRGETNQYAKAFLAGAVPPSSYTQGAGSAYSATINVVNVGLGSPSSGTANAALYRYFRLRTPALVDPTVTASGVTGAGSTTTGYSLTNRGSTLTITNVQNAAVQLNPIPASTYPATADTVTLSDGGVGGTWNANPLSVPTSGAFPGAALVWTPPAGYTGTATLTGTSANGLTFTPITFTVVAAATYQATNTLIHYPPLLWHTNATSGEMETNYSGASATFRVTGATNVVVNMDTTGLVATNYRWQVDSLTPVPSTTGAGSLSATQTLSLPDTGAHTVKLTFNKLAQGSDRWNTPVSTVKIVSVVPSAGGTLVTPTGLPTGFMLMYADSRGGDVGEVAFGYDTVIANGLGLEPAVHSFSSQGWSVVNASGVGAGYVPPVFTPGNDAASSWNKYDSTHSMLSAGKFSPMPSAVFAMEGLNDQVAGATDAAVTASVQGYLAACRAACNSTTPIYIGTDFSGAKNAAITAGFNNYQTATPDPYTKLLTVATIPGLDNTGASYLSSDGIHPSYSYTLPNAIPAGEYLAAMTGLGGGGNSAATITSITGTGTTRTLTWTADPLATLYEVERASGNAGLNTIYTVIGTTPPGTLTFTDTNRPAGTVHYTIVALH